MLPRLRRYRSLYRLNDIYFKVSEEEWNSINRKRKILFCASTVPAPARGRRSSGRRQSRNGTILFCGGPMRWYMSVEPITRTVCWSATAAWQSGPPFCWRSATSTITGSQSGEYRYGTERVYLDPSARPDIPDLFPATCATCSPGRITYWKRICPAISLHLYKKVLLLFSALVYIIW